MAVQVLTGSVVTHRGARIGVPGGDLHIAQVHASVEHGRDKRMAEHVRMCPCDLDAGGFGEVPQAAGGRVPVHPGTTVVEQDRASHTGSGRPVDGPADRGRKRDQHDLGPFTAYPQDPVTVFLADVADFGADGSEDPQAQQPSLVTRAKS